MKKTFSVMVSLVAVLVSLPSESYSEPRTLTFTVESSFDPIKGVGLLMKDAGVVQKPDVQFSKQEKGVWKATFSVDSSEIDPQTYASVMLISAEGDMAASNVRLLSEAASPPLPKCPPEQAVVLSPDTQVGVLQSLVGVRTQRRDNAQLRIATLMQGNLLETLKKLEKGFGLSRAKELSADLPPIELIDRLSRIFNAVNNYKAVKKDTQQ